MSPSDNDCRGGARSCRLIRRVRPHLVHANSSRDAAGSGRDRHANFGAGKIDIDVLVDMVTAAKAPAVICETPWSEIADDLALLRERL